MDPFTHIDAKLSGDPPVITWHLDPTVWQRAHLNGHQAELWYTGPAEQTGWAVFTASVAAAGGGAFAQGTGVSEADGKAQAEAVLRRLAGQS